MNFCAAEHHNWRLNWGFPRNDPKRYQIFILGLICPREPVLVMVDGKIYYFQVITWPLFSSLAQNKCNNGRNWSDKSKILRWAMIWVCVHAKKINIFGQWVMYKLHKVPALFWSALTAIPRPPHDLCILISYVPQSFCQACACHGTRKR